jgi:hypothetical protein
MKMVGAERDFFPNVVCFTLEVIKSQMLIGCMCLVVGTISCGLLWVF